MTEPLADVQAPALEVARAGRDVLERVLLRLSHLPAKVDRGPVQASLAASLTALGKLERSSIDDLDHLELLRAAIAAVERAHGTLTAAEALGSGSPSLSKSVLDVSNAITAVLEPTIALVVERQDHLLRRRLEAPPDKPRAVPFRVCAGVPRLFTLERDPLPLLVRSAPIAAEEDEDDEEEDRDDEDDEDDDTPPPIEREALFGAEDALSPVAAGGAELYPPGAWVRGLSRLNRDVMEEIGSLGMLRSPQGPPAAWAVGLAPFEERLLKDVDAFMALAEPTPPEAGDAPFSAIGELIAWAGDAMIPDPVRAFARTFLLGCIAGEDTARAAVMALRQSHPLTHEAERDALALAPHPGLAPLLERACSEETPQLVRLAVTVLRRRRQASFEAVAPLLSHPHAGVREAAARCLAVTPAPEAALRLLEAHAATEEDDAALLAAAEALLVLGSRKGLAVVRERLEEEAAFEGSLPKPARLEALRLLSLAGGRADGALLGRVLRHDAAAALALGWHGDAAAVPLLIGQLTEAAGIPARHGFARAIASALHRITGLGRPPNDEGRAPLPVIEPPVDAVFWSAQWETHHEKFAKPQRYRFGRPFSPIAVITEAATPESPTDVHRELCLELSILSRGASRAEPQDWVAAQLLALSEMREHFSGPGRYPEGQWPAGVLFEPAAT
jgi:hypothetical protein